LERICYGNVTKKNGITSSTINSICILNKSTTFASRIFLTKKPFQLKLFKTMKTLKSTLLIIGAAVAMLASSCDNCVAPALSENIIGSWTEKTSDSQVEFRADGTLDDPDDLLVGGEINGVALTLKSYTVDDASMMLTLTAYAPDSISSISSEVEITSNECDELEFSVLFIPVTLDRD
jgi:hypothetical protein